MRCNMWKLLMATITLGNVACSSYVGLLCERGELPLLPAVGSLLAHLWVSWSTGRAYDRRM